MSRTTQNSCFLIPHLHRGPRPNSLKNYQILHEMSQFYRNLMFGNLHPMGKVSGHITTKDFDGNSTKCTELHETHVFQLPKVLQRVGWVQFTKLCNVSYKKLMNCAQPFSIGWKLQNMSFLCRSGHFTQFLVWFH